jgi:phage tail-like protein
VATFSVGQTRRSHAAFRFAVEIDGIAEAVFTECTLPTLEVELHEQKEGGLNNAVHQIPGRIKAGKITLKQGITTSDDLLGWYLDVAQGDIEASKRSVSVIMFDSTSEEILRWNFEEAFPSKWTGPSFSAGSNEVAIETLELSYKSLDVE